MTACDTQHSPKPLSERFAATSILLAGGSSMTQSEVGCAGNYLLADDNAAGHRERIPLTCRGTRLRSLRRLWSFPIPAVTRLQTNPAGETGFASLARPAPKAQPPRKRSGKRTAGGWNSGKQLRR